MELIQSKRDYQIVVIETSETIISEAFCKKWNISKDDEIIEDEFSIIKFRMESNTQYFKGEGSEEYYLNKHGLPPYIYNIIVLRNIKANVLILCVPFKKLIIEIVDSLINEFKILTNSRFVKIDLEKLINYNKQYTDFRLDKSHFVLYSIILKTNGESYLSSLKLLGKKPLDSILYKKYIRNMISNNEFGIKRIAIKCKKSYNVIASLHIDRFGNYKFFLNEKGRNLACINDVFSLLNNLKCFIYTFNNPTLQIEDE